MKKQRKHYTPEEKAAILKRHLAEGLRISDLCDERVCWFSLKWRQGAFL
jgi:transposase-like protein